MLEEAVRAACTAPAPHHTRPWMFTVLESPGARRGLRAAMAAAWRADLERDGVSQAAIEGRLARSDAVLGAAPVLIVPWVRFDGAHPYPDPERAEAEREMFLLSGGRGDPEPPPRAPRPGPGERVDLVHALLSGGDPGRPRRGGGLARARHGGRRAPARGRAAAEAADRARRGRAVDLTGHTTPWMKYQAKMIATAYSSGCTSRARPRRAAITT
ncbi:MAG: hypothetical protein KatS3mg014_0814 [Actinomycetota bacterium]|nr:MAG: hypothetical protein KatS3mg014_0814 [Actinomycetota bacterium]